MHLLDTAVLLTGGKGTRLGALTADLPKPLVNVGDKPILEHQLELLEAYKYRRVWLMANHLSEKIHAYLQSRSSSLHVEVHIESKVLGTASGLHEIKSLLPERFLLLYGDVMLHMDLGRLARFHEERHAAMTLVVHPNDHPHDSDLAECNDDGLITGWHAKPHSHLTRYRNLVNAGVYVVERSIIESIPEGIASDFGRDLFPLWAGKKQMYAYSTPEYLKDMGTPERLEKVTADYNSGRILRSNLSNAQKAIFLDRDGVVNEEVDLLYKPEDFRLLPKVGEAIRRINRSGYLSIVATNQSVVARNLTTLEGLRDIFNTMETALGHEGAYVDAIYYCPHHPHGGFEVENTAFKIECHCRKPKPGMLLDAARAYHIDLPESWFIGDSDRDILAGKAAGVQTVGVRTGKGVKDATERADYFFDNLFEAVEYIIDDPLKEICESLVEAITSGGYGIVAVGGHSRSGKSTLSTRLAFALRSSGVPVYRLHLDDWLLPSSQRHSTMTVWDRFQIPALTKHLSDVRNGHQVRLTPYDPLTMELSKKEVSYQLPSGHVLLLDGVVACLPALIDHQASVYKVFCTVSEQVRTKRLFTFYRWKGLSDKEIEEKITSRAHEEWIAVEDTARHAHRVVDVESGV